MPSFLKSALGYLLALAAVIALPIVLRPKGESARLTGADDRLVIVTPHNEATRYEFTRAFTEHHQKATGRTVAIDWRTPGGASDISRYLASEYVNAFRLHWERDLGRRWSNEVEAAFASAWVEPGEGSGATEAQKARAAFLASKAGCGIDLYFGGGSYDFIQQANAGRLVPAQAASALKGVVPESFGGEPLYDPEGRWVGAALAAFGICYNVDGLQRLGIAQPPAAWRDLADPRLLGQTALSDPTQSGSAAKAFEMLLQQEIAATRNAQGEVDVDAGWANGVRLIRRIAGNARYFTDAASKVPWDVESGDATAGMAIDFYGRTQSEAVRKPDGSARMGYLTPAHGSSFGADPIGLLRGAPSPEVAEAFVAFVLSPDGQKLWNWKVGMPGGPERYALRRLPMLPALYKSQYDLYRSDPGVDPYRDAGLIYHPEWTGRLFRAIGFAIEVACIETHPELREAWTALVKAGFPPEATARFEAIDGITYRDAMETIRPALSSGSAIDRIRLAKSLCDRFRAQYKETLTLAKEGR